MRRYGIPSTFPSGCGAACRLIDAGGDPYRGDLQKAVDELCGHGGLVLLPPLDSGEAFVVLDPPLRIPATNIVLVGSGMQSRIVPIGLDGRPRSYTGPIIEVTDPPPTLFLAPEPWGGRRDP